MRILLAEDEKHLNENIKKVLKKNNYVVDSFYDGEAALDAVYMADYDLCILDINMPKKDGLEVLTSMRADKKNTPVLLLTAYDTVEDRVKGLDSGANDYLCKPFAFEELLARIRALTRKDQTAGMNTYTFEDLTLNKDTMVVKRGDVEVSLSTKELMVLELFMLNPGVVLSREKIENHIGNFDYDIASNVVDVYIRYLRKKIDDPFKEKYIHTIRGSGYVLKKQ